jgi:hypothetical protein
MKTIIYFEQDGLKSVSRSNPLPVVMGGFNSDSSFNVTVLLNNSIVPTLVKAATSGKSIYITDVTISAQQAGWIQLEDSSGTVVMDRIFLAANGNFTQSWNTAKKVAVSKGLMARTNIAIYMSLSVDGYIA